MKLQNGLPLLTVVLIVLLCLAFTIARPTGTFRGIKMKYKEAAKQVTSSKLFDTASPEGVKKEEVVSRIAGYVQDENAELRDEELNTISEMVYDESMRYNVDYRLVLALMKIESNFRCDVVSKQGARGLLQVKPALAKYIAEEMGIKWTGDKTLDKPGENIMIGVRALSRLIEDYQSTDMALHAYHVGPTKFQKIISQKKAPQKHYLNLVLDEYDKNISLLPAPQNQSLPPAPNN